MSTIQKDTFGRYVTPAQVDIAGHEDTIKSVISAVASTLVIGTDTEKRDIIALAKQVPGVPMAHVLAAIPEGVPKPGLDDFVILMNEVLDGIEAALPPVDVEGV